MVADVEVPAGFVPQYAVAFGAVDGPAIAVHAGNPLPVQVVRRAATAGPLAGSMTESGMAGPLVPELDRPIWVTLSGSWTGVVELLRSADGGATRLALTVGGARWGRFTANANEPVADESESGVTYYLSATLQGGALNYRVSQ